MRTGFVVTSRFRAREGEQRHVEQLVRSILEPVRTEPACVGIEAARDRDDPNCFYITSRWTDESGHVAHRDLAHTQRFLAAVAPLLDVPMSSVRSVPLA